jgi:acetylornithine deacetylase
MKPDTAPVLSGKYFDDSLTLLRELISIPSYSGAEDKTANAIQTFLSKHHTVPDRKGNNIRVKNKYFEKGKPTILLNSHHDTVKPNSGYKRGPFEPSVEDGRLYGLGSNDAGGALVSLLAAFLHFYDKQDLPFNLIYAATAEEENSGRNGIESLIDDLNPVHLAIVGEPTQMKAAIAERGLLVIDAVAHGIAGHAARNEGLNAIYQALGDIEWFRNYKFEKTSEWLGPVSMNVTMIEAGSAHNQVPSVCNFTVDIRLNEHYTHQQVMDEISRHVQSTVTARSMRIKPSFINVAHPFVKVAQQLGLEIFGSPTTSDRALMPWTSVKIGPGDSARSHSADEFIYTDEIKEGISIYINLLEQYAGHFSEQTVNP